MKKTSQSETPHATQLQGQAGVWAVAAQLALRGKVPLFPGVDHGYDIMLDNGLRLQVKSSRLKFYHPAYPDGVYSFDWRCYRWHSASKRTRMHRDYSEVADFFVCWGIDENRFWIFPCTAKQRAVWFPRGQVANWLDPKAIRELRSTGMTHQQIADQLGTSRVNVLRNLRKTSQWNDENSCRRLREYENRWDLLDTNSVEQLVEDTVKVSV